MQVIDRMGCIASHPILRNILSEKELELAAARKANQLQVKKDKKLKDLPEKKPDKEPSSRSKHDFRFKKRRQS